MSKFKLWLGLIIIIVIAVATYKVFFPTLIGRLNYFLEPPNQPRTSEDAQKRVDFVIFRPSYVPPEFTSGEKLILNLNDKQVKVTYTSYSPDNSIKSQIQINEIQIDPKTNLMSDLQNITVNVKSIEFCGLTGYAGIITNNNIQILRFNKNGTRVDLWVSENHLSEEELLKVACSLKPITN